MISKFFKTLATILVRLSGIILTCISLIMLYQSIYFCKNLTDILSVNYQIDLSVWRLLGIFILNLFGLLFDWCIALTILAISIYMILYKTKTIDKITDVDEI